MWEAMRALEVAKCQQKYRVKWRSSADSLGNFVGEGEVQIPNRWRRSRSLGFGLGLGDGLRSGQSSCGVGLGDALQLPKEGLASAVRVL